MYLIYFIYFINFCCIVTSHQSIDRYGIAINNSPFFFFFLDECALTRYIGVNELVCYMYFYKALWGLNGQRLKVNHSSGAQVSGKCVCAHHTTGDHCERCASLYNDQPWRAANGSSGESNSCQSECSYCSPTFQSSFKMERKLCYERCFNLFVMS